MTTKTEQYSDRYEVILINSGVGYAALCPGIPGAVSQGVDRTDALAMIADAMAMCQLHPLPGEDTVVRRAELRAQGKIRIAELVAECQREGWEYEVCAVVPADDERNGVCGVADAAVCSGS